MSEEKFMRIIKRYPNRKLYDTEAKQYIRLDEIATLIREGQDIQVTDHSSGDDLTALTLSQIIFEQEKQQSGFLPRSILTNLIQAGGDKISSIQRNLISPRDFLQHVDEEIKSRVNSLIAQGELLEAEGERLIQKLVPQRTREGDVDAIDDENIKRLLGDRNIPSKEEVEDINQQLDVLAAKLDELSETDR